MFEFWISKLLNYVSLGFTKRRKSSLCCQPHSLTNILHTPQYCTVAPNVFKNRSCQNFQKVFLNWKWCTKTFHLKSIRQVWHHQLWKCLRIQKNLIGNWPSFGPKSYQGNVFEEKIIFAPTYSQFITEMAC